MKIALSLALAGLVAGTPVLAQTGAQGMDHGQMNHAAKGEKPGPAAANPFSDAEMDMHRKMMAAIGTEAGETWVRKMIEHHRGAIEMARIVEKHTQDPKVRQMATKTIEQQSREVDELQAWLREKGKRTQ